MLDVTSQVDICGQKTAAHLGAQAGWDLKKHRACSTTSYTDAMHRLQKDENKTI
jgi:hypothetical protein